MSFEEYKVLQTKKDVCDYTGEDFRNDSIMHHPSIERIDKNLPYRKDNCCIVTVIANQLKDSIEEGCEDNLKIKDFEIVQKIKQTLKSKTRLELASKYFPEVLSQEEDNNMNTDTIVTVHNDVEIAKHYAEFASKEADFQVSFSMFKKKFIKNKCEFSGKTFDKNNHYLNKRITKKDYDKPFTDDNIKVVCLVIDNIMKSGIFDKKDLIKIANNF